MAGHRSSTQPPAPRRRYLAQQTVTKEDFESLLMDSFVDNEPLEGAVVKGTVVAIEKDLAIIDVGLKTEGRIALKEFGQAGRDGTIKVGSIVEVYVDRVENAAGEAVLSREKARPKRAGSSSKSCTTTMSALKAPSSTRSRAASRSTSKAPSPSCRVRRWTFVRSAISHRS